MKTISLVGNVGKTAETRTTQNGNKVTSFSLAVSHYDGKENATLWFDVSMWGKRGEAVVQFAQKGAKIAVSGDFSTREYEGKTYLQCNATDFTPCGGKSEGQTHHNSGSDGPQAPARDLDDVIDF